MARTKKFIASAYCPCCKDHCGKIYERQLNETVIEYVTEPKVLPKRCSKCEGVLVRKNL